jgi:uncharacterized repeat protein (TIGR04076 family)
MIEEVKQKLRQNLGITDEDFKTYIGFPHNRKILEHRQELAKYKIIAEVTESKYCSAGLKLGQKYIFNTMPAVLLAQESDCPLCMRALGPIAHLMIGFWDRIVEGINPNQGMWYMAECLDPGINRGGLGHVVFKVYAQKRE